MALLAGISACLPTRDLARSLRYANNHPVGAENIKFLELNKMKRGKACTLDLLMILPLFGDGSIITAANKGNINNVELIGETGWWFFPFCTSCTVVFGDKSAIKERPEKTTPGDNSTIEEKPEKTTPGDNSTIKEKPEKTTPGDEWLDKLRNIVPPIF